MTKAIQALQFVILLATMLIALWKLLEISSEIVHLARRVPVIVPVPAPIIVLPPDARVLCLPPVDIHAGGQP